MPPRSPDDHRRWRRIADDLWSFHAPLNLGLADIGRRMVAARRPGGGWMLLSPVPPGARGVRQLLDEAPVEALVVPTAFHNTFVPESAEQFPEARIYLTAGAKRPPGVESRIAPIEALAEHWHEVALPLPIDGMPRANEVAFLHRDSRSLIVADLCFNFDSGYGLGVKILMGLFRGYPGVRQSLLYRSLIRDRAAYRASVERILAHDFARVIPCHGRVLERGGHAALSRLLR